MCQNVVAFAQPQPNLPELRFTQKRAASPGTQFKMLIQRFFRMYWRTPSYNFTRFMCYIFLSVLLGVMYINVDYSAYSGATSGMGMMFMLALFGSVVCFNCMLPLASEERPSFYRERACQTYQAWWYFVASTLVEIPYCIGLALIIIATFYPLVGFSGSAADIFLFIFGFTLLAILSVSIGEFLAFAIPQIEIASLMLILINGIFSLFVGFNPPASQIPSGYRWLYHITPLKYCLALLTSIAFGKCDDGTEYGCLVLRDVSPAILNKVGTPTITLKTFVEEIFEMRADEVGWNILGIFISIFVFRFGTLLSMQFLNYQKR
ncbi:ATP-binding Cassette (ABC) Superfamily [Thraustotheca clavata]|uniref:ATP-binding Cassette (ABC) Superfamily n=1 Tax=Thraustotheca clavata TaxID=74557 RepID=A0A1V9YTF3_9STRA|nr:ATP-binding Cassette (ABC) Superfamily [Thraustotheca clavata]